MSSSASDLPLGLLGVLLGDPLDINIHCKSCCRSVVRLSQAIKKKYCENPPIFHMIYQSSGQHTGILLEKNVEATTGHGGKIKNTLGTSGMCGQAIAYNGKVDSKMLRATLCAM